MRRVFLAGLLFSACATAPEPVRAPAPGAPSAVELFHRARFSELARGNPAVVGALAESLYTRGSAAKSADWSARASYRDGDATAATVWASRLPENNKTRRLLEALLAHANPTAPLRSSSRVEGTLQLPLRAKALDRGYPVIDARLAGRTIGLLWDTGANENVLDPRLVEELELDRADVSFQSGALIVRASATATPDVELAGWRIANIPWLVAELDTVRGAKDIDGFLSPQLLLPRGCFEIDRLHAVLTIGFDAPACKQLVAHAGLRSAIYGFDGEVYASATVHHSPELAVQIETGSAVTFLRGDATRYLPEGALREKNEAGIALEMQESIGLVFAGRAKALSAIDLASRRQGAAHDDVATIGTDLLLQGRGIVVSFATMEMGTVDAPRAMTKIASR